MSINPKIKKWIVPGLMIIGVIILYLYYRAKSAASSSSSTSDGSSVQAYPQTYAVNPTSAGGGAITTQPGTSASGVSAYDPSVQPYVSPTATQAGPSPDTSHPGSQSIPYYSTTPGTTSNIPTDLSRPDVSFSDPAAAFAHAVATTPATATSPGGLDQIPMANSYLNSVGFRSSEAHDYQVECAAAPNSPACQVALVTGDIATGGGTRADVALNAANYCEQNQANASIFGLPVDTGNCNGADPNATLVNQMTQQGQPQPSTNTGGVGSMIGFDFGSAFRKPGSTVITGDSVSGQVSSTKPLGGTNFTGAHR